MTGGLRMVEEPGGVVPNLDFLEGQSPWLILAVVLITAAAFVLRGAVKRSNDTGQGQAGLDSADAAADYLARRASEERDARVSAEARYAVLEQRFQQLETERDELEESLNKMSKE